MDTCKHVDRLNPANDHSILNPQKWMCADCATTESVWACLNCANVACGRYNESHALKHYKETKHPLALEVNEKYVYCYECDDYVMNDNASGDLKLLRTTLQAIATQSFTDIESRGKRFLRSHSFSGYEAKSAAALREQDRKYTALRHRRIMLLTKCFEAWRGVTKKLARTPDQTPEKTRSRLHRRVRTSTASPVSTPPKKKWTLTPGITGLRNLGNTCYMNSILQLLSNLAQFKEYFHNLHEHTDPTDSNMQNPQPNNKYMRQTTIECFQHVTSTCTNRDNVKGGLNGGGSSQSASNHQKPPSNLKSGNVYLCQELHALIRVMWSGKWAIVSPHAMLNAVWTVIPFFKGYAQQDAQEFLCELLDKVDSELDRCYRDHSKPVHIPASNIIAQTFQGQLVSEVICQACLNTSKTYEPFMDLSLEFPDRYHQTEKKYKEEETMEPCHLTEMLSKFTETETLDGEIYACEKCNNKRRKTSSTSDTITLSHANKQLRINKLPKVLRLHLKRFRWLGRNNREKINIHVNFEELLDMTPYCHPDQPNDSYLYQLSSVIMHHGRGFGSGHYTAYVFNEETESFYHCNDANLCPCPLPDVLKAQGYILVYTQLQQPDTELSFPYTDIIEEVDKEVSFNFKNSDASLVLRKRRELCDGNAESLKVSKRRRTCTW
ncbi:unnamed protein product [Owenia fusiformis]|uniref:Ubiquitin carboxyl-terminal hydrolase n=1 Tax=Owenia fusiformis TaxID=6347 RepID=A0A8S4NYZ5_OWEFU|nr:unnamed protein product [Owenia fusiformis]